MPSVSAAPASTVLVSVVIPAYNASLFLPATLRSVLAQDYPHFEVWVVDDGSTDETADIVRGFEDDRIHLIQQENAGVAAARNHGIQRSRGEFIAPLDADDLWEPHALRAWVERFAKSSQNVGVVYGWSIDVDECDRPTGGFHGAKIRGEVLGTLLVHNFLGNASATMIRRSALLEVGGYDGSLRDRQAQGCEDWDLYFKLAAGWEFEVVPQVLVRYRKPVMSMSQDDQQMARSHDLVLEALRGRTGEQLPRWMYGLSRSSLYVHFAHQSAQFGRSEQARDWCRLAVKVDRMTPWLRPGWYHLRFGRVKQSVAVSHRSLNKPPTDLQIQLKIWVSGVLHFGVRVCLWWCDRLRAF